MNILPVDDAAFAAYGMTIDGFDFGGLIAALEKNTEKPADKVIYVASDAALEALPVFNDLQNRLFGGLPIQIGYCNGYNTRLNCLEYHRGSEACIAADDLVLMLAKKEDVSADFCIDSSKVKAFLVPKGRGVLCYETALHYAPARAAGPFRSVIVLPRGTNTDIPSGMKALTAEDGLLAARNKWLLAHADSPEAKNGAPVRISGANLDLV